MYDTVLCTTVPVLYSTVLDRLPVLNMYSTGTGVVYRYTVLNIQYSMFILNIHIFNTVESAVVQCSTVLYCNSIDYDTCTTVPVCLYDTVPVDYSMNAGTVPVFNTFYTTMSLIYHISISN